MEAGTDGVWRVAARNTDEFVCRMHSFSRKRIESVTKLLFCPPQKQQKTKNVEGYVPLLHLLFSPYKAKSGYVRDASHM